MQQQKNVRQRPSNTVRPRLAASPTAACELLESRRLFAAAVEARTLDFDKGAELTDDLHVQADGKLVLLGHTGAVNAPGAFILARYRPDFTLDRTFNRRGKLESPIAGFTNATAVTAQRNESILVAGTVGSNVAVARFNRDGTLDKTLLHDQDFATVSVGGTQVAVSGIAVNISGRYIYLAGTSDNQFFVARLDTRETNGLLDDQFGIAGVTKFNFGAGVARATNFIVDADGGIRVAGNYAEGNVSHYAIAHLTAAGQLDASFGGGDGRSTKPFVANASVTRVEFLPSGKVYAVGTRVLPPFASDPTGPQRTHAALGRYTGAGTPDPTFGTKGLVLGTVQGFTANDVRLAPDGGVYAVGHLDIRAGDRSFALERFTRDGRPDTAFDGDGVQTFNLTPKTGLFDSAARAVVQPSGEMVVAGVKSLGLPGQDIVLERFSFGKNLVRLTSGGTLIVRGLDASADRIRVRSSGVVDYNGATLPYTLRLTRRVQIFGFGGNDTLVNDTAFRCSMNGGGGEDTLVGGSGYDDLFGENENDLLRGNAGRDLLRGDDGHDTLVGGPGQDTMLGGVGDDVFRNRDAERDSLEGGLGNDDAEPDNAGNEDIDMYVGIETINRRQDRPVNRA